MTKMDTPACWSWSVTSGHLASVASCPETFAHLLLWNWQRGQCATCGVLASDRTPLVRDHDHLTGHIRGLLCQSCNTNEGHTAAGIKPQSNLFDRYRDRHPAAILQLQARHECTVGPFGRRLPKVFAGSVMLPTLGERWTLQDIDWGTDGPGVQLGLDLTDYWMIKEPDRG